SYITQLRPQPRSNLFPYTTLFRSQHAGNLQVNLIPKTQRTISDVGATEKIRGALRDVVPGTRISFFTGGIVKRILNFGAPAPIEDRKSTRLNSSHSQISYAVFCLK